MVIAAASALVLAIMACASTPEPNPTSTPTPAPTPTPTPGMSEDVANVVAGVITAVIYLTGSLATGLVAKRKGRRFWPWWVFGILAWWIALPILALIKPAQQTVAHHRTDRRPQQEEPKDEDTPGKTPILLQLTEIEKYLDPEMRKRIEKEDATRRARLTALAVFLPPLALVLAGEISNAIANLLCCWPFGLLPGILHAVTVIHQTELTTHFQFTDEEMEKIQGAVRRARQGIRPKERTIPPALREAVLRRDQYVCRYCGRRSQTLEIDHVIPVSKGGKATMNNLVTACRHCNRKKGGRTPEEAGLTLRPPGTHKRPRSGIWPF